MDNYMKFSDIIFTYLEEPDIIINREKLFLNPLKNYME